MTLEDIHHLYGHVAWADARLLQALRTSGPAPAEAVREFAHILGADEIWLSRLEGRASRTAVWPAGNVEDLEALADLVHQGFGSYLAGLDAQKLEQVVAYTTSAGTAFQNRVQEILVHVALHAQYHRGKVNLLLRQVGLEPAPTDYIAFLRGVPAARTPPASGSNPP